MVEQINGPTKKSAKNVFLWVILFFISPFATFIVALFNYTKKESLFIFALFVSYYGFKVRPKSPEEDLFRYLNELQYYSHFSFNSFTEKMWDYFIQSPGSSVDIYRDVVAFSISRITLDGSVLMAVFGLVFGIFIAWSLSIIFEYSRSKDLFSILILIALISQNSLNMLGGVRFGTATYLFFVAALRYIEQPRKKYLMLAMASALFHFSFIPMVLLLWIHGRIKNRMIPYLGFFFVSFVNINIPAMIEVVFERREESIARQAWGYSREEYAIRWIERMSTVRWPVIWTPLGQQISYYFMLGMIYFNKEKSIIFNTYSKSVFYFSLLTFSFANLVRNVPTLGRRIFYVAMMFVFYFLYVLYKDNKNNPTVRLICLIAIIAAGLKILISLRAIITSLGPSFYYGNFFIN